MILLAKSLAVLPSYTRTVEEERILYGGANANVVKINDPSPLITVSERQIDDFSIFLSKNGFKLKDKVKSIYRRGEYEYFYNKEYKHIAVI